MFAGRLCHWSAISRGVSGWRMSPPGSICGQPAEKSPAAAPHVLRQLSRPVEPLTASAAPYATTSPVRATQTRHRNSLPKSYIFRYICPRLKLDRRSTARNCRPRPIKAGDISAIWANKTGPPGLASRLPVELPLNPSQAWRPSRYPSRDDPELMKRKRRANKFRFSIRARKLFAQRFHFVIRRQTQAANHPSVGSTDPW